MQRTSNVPFHRLILGYCNTVQDVFLAIPLVNEISLLTYLQLTVQFLLVVWSYSALGITLAHLIFLPDILLGSEMLPYLILASISLLSAVEGYGIRLATSQCILILVLTWFFETLSIHTSFPFGCYVYSDQLGPSLTGVPLLIPIAWFMMAYPSYINGILILTRWPWIPLSAPYVGALFLTAWALPMDPYMSQQGFWVWLDEGLWFGTPVINYLGWLLVSFLIMLSFHFSAPCNNLDYKKPLCILSYVAMMMTFIPIYRSTHLLLSVISFLITILTLYCASQRLPSTFQREKID